MRRICLPVIILLALFVMNRVQAQSAIPNGNFSSWVNDSVAASWSGVISVDVMIYSFDINTIKKTTDANSSPSAMMVKTEKTIPILGTLLFGVASLGKQKLDILSFSIVFSGGAPISVKPTKLKGYYKYVYPAKDTMFIAGICKQGTDTIATGAFFSSLAQSSYTYFEFPFDYSINQTPDTINVVCISSAGNNPQSGTTLYVDDLEIEYTGMGGPETVRLDELINAWPNPSNGLISIGLTPDENNLISIYDVSGRTLMTRTSSEHSETVDMTGFENGMYLIGVQNSSGNHLKRFLLAR